VLATYRPERQKDASAYDLRAGYGLHVPPNAPHWVQNGNNVSVALSVNYELRSVGRLTDLHRFNRKLRGIGLDPVPPGRSQWRDEVKLAAYRAARSLRKRQPIVPPYSVWTPPPA
jgi:hypothetical protein